MGARTLRRIRVLRSVLTTLLLLTISSPATAEPKVDVHFLANEGLLLSHEGQKVLIDAFVTEPYSIYGAVPEDIWQSLLAKEAPFEQIQLALTSHPHRDHFQPEAAKAFLEAHPETLFASSPEVIASLREILPADSDITDRLREILPEPGETEILERGEIRVEFLRLQHGGQRWTKLQNLGHIIQLGGKSFLHVGDAATSPENFSPYRLAERQLDVAFVPIWFFSQPSGQVVIREHFASRHHIAVHISPRATSTARSQLASEEPKVVIFEKALEKKSY